VLPWGHAGLGYLLYAGLALATGRRLPRGWPLAALLVGTQFPDLVDKPLAFLGVLPNGRTGVHTLLVTTLLLAATWLVAVRVDAGTDGRTPRAVPWSTAGSGRGGAREVALAYSVGHLSHLLGDSYAALLTGYWRGFAFLLYPFVPAPRYLADRVAPWERLADAALTTRVTFQVVLAVGAGLVLLYGAYRRQGRRTIAPRQ